MAYVSQSPAQLIKQKTLTDGPGTVLGARQSRLTGKTRIQGIRK